MAQEMGFFRGDDDQWEIFDEAFLPTLNASFEGGEDSTVLLIGATSYLCDFESMVQQNLDTGFTRRICRGLPAERSPPTARTRDPVLAGFWGTRLLPHDDGADDDYEGSDDEDDEDDEDDDEDGEDYYVDDDPDNGVVEPFEDSQPDTAAAASLDASAPRHLICPLTQSLMNDPVRVRKPTKRGAVQSHQFSS